MQSGEHVQPFESASKDCKGHPAFPLRKRPVPEVGPDPSAGTLLMQGDPGGPEQDLERMRYRPPAVTHDQRARWQAGEKVYQAPFGSRTA